MIEMKKILYPIFVLFLICMLSSCEISEDDLDSDIRNKFEKELNGTIERPGKYDDDCTLSLGETAFLRSEGAVRVILTGKSTGYKYYFSDLPYTDEQIRIALESKKRIEGEEFNFAVKSYSISYGGKAELYLYVVGYDDRNHYGPIVEAHYTVNSEWSYADPFVGVTAIKKNEEELSWDFTTSYFKYGEIRNIDYYVLVDDEADNAKNLSDPELAIYVKSLRKYSAEVKDRENTPCTLKLGVNPRSVMIVTETPSPLTIKGVYKSF